MNEKPRFVLAFDCDDVLVENTAYRLAEYYKKTHGHEVDPVNFYGGPVDWGVTTMQEAGERIEPFFRTYGHELLEPSTEAIEAIDYLANHPEFDFEPHVVTGRADFMEPITAQMNEEYFNGNFHGIHHTNFNKLVSATKGSVCRRIGALVLTDDHVLHCHSVIDEGTPRAIVFGDYPWNRHETLSSSMTRAFDWQVTTEEVIKIAKSRI